METVESAAIAARLTAPRRSGPGRPRKVSVEDQRERILTAAKAAFAEQGRGGVTVEQIARSADVSRQQIYEQFGDKAGLFDAVVSEYESIFTDEWLTTLRKHEELGIRGLFRATYQLAFDLRSRYPGAVELLSEAEREGNAALTRIQQRRIDALRDTVAARWSSTPFAPPRADRALNAMYRSMAESVMNVQWPDSAPEVETLIDLLTEFSLGGLIWLTNRRPEIIEKLG